ERTGEHAARLFGKLELDEQPRGFAVVREMVLSIAPVGQAPIEVRGLLQLAGVLVDASARDRRGRREVEPAKLNVQRDDAVEVRGRLFFAARLELGEAELFQKARVGSRLVEQRNGGLEHVGG